jgi:phosphate uptake regulator
MVGCPGEQRRGKNMPNESLKNLQIGDMQQLEAIINNLRNDDYVDRCYRQHMRYIYEKMKEKDKTKGYTAMVLQLYRSPLDEARKLCGFGL